MNNKVLCECGETYNSSYKFRHENSNKHKQYFLSDGNIESDNINDDNISDITEPIDNNFLNELNNDNFKSELDIDNESDMPKVPK